MTGADVVLLFAMLDMEMRQQSYTMTERSPGTYSRTTPALVMVGPLGRRFEIEPNGGAVHRHRRRQGGGLT